MTKRSATPLTPASRDDVRKALDSLVNVLDVISLHYTGSTNLFKWSGVPEGAVALLHVLQDGVRERDARHARWDRGEIDPIEIQPIDVQTTSRIFELNSRTEERTGFGTLSRVASGPDVR